MVKITRHVFINIFQNPKNKQTNKQTKNLKGKLSDVNFAIVYEKDMIILMIPPFPEVFKNKEQVEKKSNQLL